jgi:hypothetical protein
LDSANTETAVGSLPKLFNQAVLLVLDGEFDRDTAVQALGSHLKEEFELVRVSSQETRIEIRRSR